MNEEKTETQPEKTLEESISEALLSCEKCHLCNTDCPICDHRITQGPFGIGRAIYYGLKWNQFNKELRDLVYSCTTCGKCVATCKHVSRALPLIEIFEKAREFLFVEKMLGPMPDQRGVLKNVYRKGNPWGYSPGERTKWAEDLDIKRASEDEKVDVLYFVGCTSSYDPQSQAIAKSLGEILKRASVDFGIADQEKCSGSEARRMGETGLFEFLAEANMEIFKEAGVKHIVTGDPHSFYSFSQEYPCSEDGLKIQHHTQILNELIDEGKLKLSTKVNKKVTYHDPCYLGRRSEVFEEPRKLIEKIPGITFVEMRKNRENSDCCGMGGGRMWMEAPEGLVSSDSIAKRRIEQALETGADILVTACPFCHITLNDAAKAMGDEASSITVMDIAELVRMSL